MHALLDLGPRRWAPIATIRDRCRVDESRVRFYLAGSDETVLYDAGYQGFTSGTPTCPASKFGAKQLQLGAVAYSHQKITLVVALSKLTNVRLVPSQSTAHRTRPSTLKFPNTSVRCDEAFPEPRIAGWCDSSKVVRQRMSSQGSYCKAELLEVALRPSINMDILLAHDHHRR